MEEQEVLILWFSYRNNVLHLWPYNIHELRAMGAKKFYGKFCAGAIDHISIRWVYYFGINIEKNPFLLVLEAPFLSSCGFTVFLTTATATLRLFTHPSANRGPSCLTSVILLELVFLL